MPARSRRQSSRTGRRITVVIALVLVLVAGTALQASGRPQAAAPPRVTMIGDSVATSLEYTQSARAILAQGVDLQLELAPCRRVGQSSCPYDGARPPTVVDLVPTLGDALGQTVVVAVGYNDYESAYAGDIEDALTALNKAGVTRVLWLTLHEERPSYATMNDAIHAAATRYPELTVVDWQVYSRSHPDWFQADGIHLQRDGAVAMATLVHNALEALDIPLAVQAAQPATGIAVVSARLPDAIVGRPYSAKLVARGGTRPFRWTRVRGTLPRGLKLLSDGRINGVPKQSGPFAIVTRVTDVHQAMATHTVTLRVRPKPDAT